LSSEELRIAETLPVVAMVTIASEPEA
jgi:hypothetical protein